MAAETSTQTLTRLFPPYALPTRSKTALRPWTHHPASPLRVQLLSDFMAAPINRPLRRLAYVPLAPTAHHADPYTRCGLCEAHYTSAIHGPVMLRCGCVFGEVCVVQMLAARVEAVEMLHAVMPEEAAAGKMTAEEVECRCPGEGCGRVVAPMREWEAMRRGWGGWLESESESEPSVGQDRGDADMSSGEDVVESVEVDGEVGKSIERDEDIVESVERDEAPFGEAGGVAASDEEVETGVDDDEKGLEAPDDVSATAESLEMRGDDDEEDLEIALFEISHVGQFHEDIFEKWSCELRRHDDLAWNEGPWVVVEANHEAVGRAHLGIVDSNYWDEWWNVKNKRREYCIQPSEIPEVLDEVVVLEFLDCLRQYTGTRRELTKDFVNDLIDGTHEAMENWAHRFDKKLPEPDSPKDIVYNWYIEQLVEHSLVQIRMDQGVGF